MNGHGKKIVAPVVITVAVIAYLFLYFGLLASLAGSAVLRLLALVVPVLLGAAMTGVCIQRIREIKGGEEDDLGQY